MAFVALPCDLPFWKQLEDYIRETTSCRCIDDLMRQMQCIYDLCDISLEPDAESIRPKSDVFCGLEIFLRQDFSESEREHFFDITLPIIAESALNLKILKPPNGLPFNLQQEESSIEISRDFAASLIAHAFFSTFPRRTDKTHPTLQDFNFRKFFCYLHQNYQKSKLKSVLRYFELSKQIHFPISDSILICRRIAKEDQMLTMDDWFGSDIPLCDLAIKHENRMENADSTNSSFVCFSSRKPGGGVLLDGKSLECIRFATCPELLVTLLMAEALDANEALVVEKLVMVSKIQDGVLRIDSESDKRQMKLLDVCLVDAGDYRHSPTSQYSEGAVLRELNKALIGFAGHRSPCHPHPRSRRYGRAASLATRLSPIGESCSATPVDDQSTKLPSDGRVAGRKTGQKADRMLAKCRRYVTAEEWPPTESRVCSDPSTATDEQHQEDGGLHLEWCGTGCDAEERRSPSTATEFYSAADSLSDAEYSSEEEEDEEGQARRYSGQLDSVESRHSFAERLRAALRRAASGSASDESNYAVDISVTGSSIADHNIRMRRGGSRGFMLENDSSDEDISSQILRKKSRFHAGQPTNESNAIRKITSRNSSKYSFSTDCGSSDVVDVCNQLNRWLSQSQDDDDGDGYWLQQKLREEDAIGRFARRLLKRALSESFVGVELTDGGDRLKGFEDHKDEHRGDGEDQPQSDNPVVAVERLAGCEAKFKMVVRSLSLELQRNQRLASKLADGCVKGDAHSSGPTIVTGNWGCGSHSLGDCQLKLLIQWVAASVAGASRILYYTCNRRQLAKLDTLCRILVDRRWNVGDLMRATMHYAQLTTTGSTEKSDASVDRRRSTESASRSSSSSTDENQRLVDDLTIFDLLISSDRKIGPHIPGSPSP